MVTGDAIHNNNSLYATPSTPPNIAAASKEYKICDVLGGLDVTRLVSTNTRNFFRSAIEDAELLREYLVETTKADTGKTASGFSSLQEMSHSLDWVARGVPENTTTLDLNLGFTDDRPTRRVDRFVGLTNQPLVGTKETDFFMMDGLSDLFPWVVDRRSRESHWWLDHQIGRTEGPGKEPFAFDILYSGAWLISYGDSLLYYPPLTVYQHPLTFGDRVGSTWNSHLAPFSKPNFPQNNPDRITFFSKPYPDTAVPGLSLVSAIAPVYYTGQFRGHTYDDTYVASLGVDIATSSVSSFLDILEDSLTPGSYGLLVNQDLGTIVISQEVVTRIYPPRTGMEETRVTYNPDGSIAVDRRNQTYLPSDTILQDLTLLHNADWKGLKQTIDAAPVGVRDFTTLDIQLTNATKSTEYYVMFERWQYVANWTLLVFAPAQQVEDAIHVYLTTDPDLKKQQSNSTILNTTGISLEGIKDTRLPTPGAWIVNQGNLDVKVAIKKIPEWAQLHDTTTTTTPANSESDTYLLKAGEHLSIGFDVTTNNLETGTQSSALTFEVQDADYPDCFFRQELSLPLTVRVLEMTCPGKHSVPNEEGICVCNSGSIDIGGDCVQTLAVVMGVVVPILVLTLLGMWLYSRHKRQVADSMWKIDPSELTFEDESHVIGEGSFSSVVLAEMRGTTVAVKRMHQSTPRGGERRGSVFGLRRSSALSGGAGIDFGASRRASATSSGIMSSASELVEIGMAEPEQHPVEGMDESARYSTIHMGNNKNVTPRRSSILGNASAGADFVKEMRLLSQLRHPNIVTVMGAIDPNNLQKIKSTVAPPMRSIVLEYMENGSLYDCLQRAIELDGEMIISILQGVSKGLQFLHYSKPKAIMHGDLKAANILLDGNFKAKLTDFGLSSSGRNRNGRRTGTPFWMAPEVLTGETDNTPASDIYSLGCVLYEIYARKEPYLGEDPAQVIEEVCDPNINRRPPKPIVMPQGVAALMHDCLVAEASERPSLEEISSRLKRFHDEDVDPIGMVKKSKGDTKDFELLLQLFPRHIAEALRDGRPVEPEQHDCVSIFFSDIVGFTTISTSMEPNKVSDMLHRLFLKMDAIADELELYKVETIGDAWFGCTNCVKPQEKDHAKRIAEFSLRAMQAANETLIDLDNPDRGFVNIRVGFHCGPVYTNVIGSRNPHYTLFGDTVNTASRMESNSLPGRIQCTEAAAKLVMEQAPKIKVTCRGKIPVKGKGEMTTFWIGDYNLENGEAKLVTQSSVHTQAPPPVEKKTETEKPRNNVQYTHEVEC